MNSKQRILTALNMGRPDRVPVCELYLNESSIVRIARLLRPDQVGDRHVEEGVGEQTEAVLDLYCMIVAELGLDATCQGLSIGLEPVGGGRARDRYGTLYNLSPHGEPMPVDGPIKEPSDLEGFDMVSKLRASDLDGMRYVMEKAGPEKAHFLGVTDPFKVSWRRTGGMQNLLMHYVLNPALVHRLGRIATDFDIAVIEMAAGIGVDVIIVPGDLAGERTTIISPEHYRQYIKPYHAELVEAAHRRGLKIVKHSDGNLWPILHDLLEVGFDGLHPIQPQCMDIAEVKEYLAGRACVVGNIDCRELLVFGSRQEVEQSVKETIEKAAPGGGYILSSSNSIHPGCKPENYVAMVRAAHRYGSYG